MPQETSTQTNETSLSFTDYKIDYSHPLGSGVFGTVYPLIERPEEEKGIFSYWCPYLYDWIYREPQKEHEPGQFCVKVSKSSLRMVYENPNHSCRYRLPWHSLFEGKKEKQSNQVLKRHGMSNITFFKSDSLYSEFKTRIHGNTLHHYLSNGSLVNPCEYTLRKRFVDFMQLLKSPKFTFWDLNENNLMYDEMRQQWEIIDGIFNEVTDTKIEAHSDNLLFFHEHLLQSEVDIKTREVLKHLVDMAARDTEYSEADDRILMEKPVTPSCR